MNKIILVVLTLSASLSQADCYSEYRNQLSYLSPSHLSEGFVDSLKIVDRNGMGLIFEKLDSDETGGGLTGVAGLDDALFTTTGPTSTTTGYVIAIPISPIVSTSNYLDDDSRFNETLSVFKMLQEYDDTGSAGLRNMKFYTQLRSMGYNDSFENFHASFQEMNKTDRLCASDRDHVMPASELAVYFLNQ